MEKDCKVFNQFFGTWNHCCSYCWCYENRKTVLAWHCSIKCPKFDGNKTSYYLASMVNGCKCMDHKMWTEDKHIQEYLPQFLNRNFIIISHLISKLINAWFSSRRYRQTTHPQLIYNAAICNFCSVRCLSRANERAWISAVIVKNWFAHTTIVKN